MAGDLDAIDWSTLLHAYGEASDVPDDLRQLSNENEQTRKDALGRLSSSIFHQSTRYTATVPAIPFLADAALQKQTPQTVGIINLLKAIAEPFVWEIVKTKQTVATYRDVSLKADQDLNKEGREWCEEFGTWPSIEAKVYDAVSSEMGRLSGLIESSDIKVQAATINLLACFPEYWMQALPAISQFLENSAAGNDGDYQRLVCFDAIGTASELIEIGPQDELLMPWLSPGNTVMTRARAALALKGAADQANEVFLNCLDTPHEIFKRDRELEFFAGWTAVKIANQIAIDHNPSDKAALIPKLIGTLFAARTAKAATSVIVHAMVTVLAGKGNTRDYFSERGSSDLTDMERDVLNEMANSACQTSHEENEMIRSYGLPDTSIELRRYAEKPRGTFSWIKQKLK